MSKLRLCCVALRCVALCWLTAKSKTTLTAGLTQAEEKIKSEIKRVRHVLLCSVSELTNSCVSAELP